MSPDTTVMVTASSLSCLRELVLLGLVFQLSTLLLVLAGPVPPRLSPAIGTNHFRLDPDPNSALNRPVTALPISGSLDIQTDEQQQHIVPRAL